MTRTNLPVAYSYIRFSSPQQASGDSLRRQLEWTSQWAERNGVHLDTSLTLRALGVSAFRGRHRDDNTALGGFLKLARDKRIKKGSYLVIENLDRLSREDERTALRLWMDILDAGINIVQLKPETVFRHEKSDLMDVMRAIIELSRGHSESRMKSERLHSVWSERKRKAREEGFTATQRVPAWVQVIDGERLNIADRVAVIQRIYDMAANGVGHGKIARILAREGVPCFGAKGVWSRSYIAQILKDRRLLGEYQPRGRDGEPDGDVIHGYYNPVVTVEQFYAAQSAQVRRRSRRTPPTVVELEEPPEEADVIERHKAGISVARIAQELHMTRPRIYRILVKHGLHEAKDQGARTPYLFAGLLVNARDGRNYYPQLRVANGVPYKVLVAASHANTVGGGNLAYGFPLRTFERAVLALLGEIDPVDVLGSHQPQHDVGRLRDALAGIRQELAEMSQFTFNPTLGRMIQDREATKADLEQQLEVALRQSAAPLQPAWEEMQTLLGAIDRAADADAVRMRLRVQLRRIVESITLFVTSRGKERFCVTQITFVNGKQRMFLIWHRPPIGNAKSKKDGRWWATSWQQEKLTDLSTKEDQELAEHFLAAFDLENLDASTDNFISEAIPAH